jgi:hypothetical protein
MPRFVLLEHDHPFLHWDLMLEAGQMLRTWRLTALPESGREIAAESLGDHRRAYLDYEGPLSGGRGTVRRWDAGTFQWIRDEANEIEIRLEGEHCRRCAILRRNPDGAWSCSFE